MTRHLDNLDRLCNKLHERYGAQDPLCLQAREALETGKAQKPPSMRQHDWSVPYRVLIQDRQSEFMQQVQRPTTRPHSAS